VHFGSLCSYFANNETITLTAPAQNENSTSETRHRLLEFFSHRVTKILGVYYPGITLHRHFTKTRGPLQDLWISAAAARDIPVLVCHLTKCGFMSLLVATGR